MATHPRPQKVAHPLGQVLDGFHHSPAPIAVSVGDEVFAQQHTQSGAIVERFCIVKAVEENGHYAMVEVVTIRRLVRADLTLCRIYRRFGEDPIGETPR